MAEHPNAALPRKGFDAFAKRDMAALTELFAEDAVLHVSERGARRGSQR